MVSYSMSTSDIRALTFMEIRSQMTGHASLEKKILSRQSRSTHQLTQESIFRMILRRRLTTTMMQMTRPRSIRICSPLIWSQDTLICLMTSFSIGACQEPKLELGVLQTLVFSQRTHRSGQMVLLLSLYSRETRITSALEPSLPC
jgi:hypothetical protein